MGERVWRGLTLGCALLIVAPLFAAKYLPFSDLPEHVATIATLQHWWDPTWSDGRIYAFQGLKSPYLAYHALGALLAFVTGDAIIANRLLLAASGLALPYAVRSLAAAFGGDRRVAILACPLFWSRPLLIGFLPYIAAVPVTLFGLALVVRQTERWTARRAAVLAPLALFLFYLHLDAFLLLAVVSAALHVVPPGPCAEPLARRLSLLPGRLAWLAFAAAAALVWYLRADLDGGPSLLASTDVTYIPLHALSGEFAAWTHDIWRSHVDEATGVAFWVLVTLLAWQYGERESQGARGVAGRWMPFLCALVLFIAMPYRVGTGAMLNVRLAVFLGLLVLVVVRPDRRRLTDVVFGAGVVLTLAVAANAAVEIHAAERDELAGFEALLDRVEPGKRLLSLQFDRSSAHTEFSPWIHMAAYHRLRRGGVASISFTELPHWPLRYRPVALPPHEHAPFLEWRPCFFRNSVDGPYYDFVLTRGSLDPFGGDPPGPTWRMAGRALDWTLYAKAGDGDPRRRAEDAGPCARPPPDTPAAAP